MSMINHLRRLLLYDEWANREVLAGLRAASFAPQRVVKLLGHVLAAEKLWLQRLLSEDQTLPVWPELSLEECEAEANELPLRWRTYLAAIGEKNLGSTIAYKNSKGENWKSSVEDVLLHVVMHSAYHRGQIAAEVRSAGLSPAYTDYIHAARSGILDRLPGDEAQE